MERQNMNTKLLTRLKFLVDELEAETTSLATPLFEVGEYQKFNEFAEITELFGNKLFKMSSYRL